MSLVLCAALLVGVYVAAARDGTGTARSAPGQSSSCTIQSTVIGCAGSPGTSTQYSMNGTMGQPTPIGIGTAGGRTVLTGFWGWKRIPTDVDEIPLAFRLRQNYPNPFNPVTTIEFTVARGCPVDLTIYDVVGRRIRRMVHETRAPGRYREIWDGTNDRGALAASGLYFYRLRAGSFVSVKKMILMR